MKHLCISLLVWACLLLNTNTAESQGYKSCASVLAENSELLKGQSFFIFPELRENPIKWFDSIAVERSSNINQQKSFSLDAQPERIFCLPGRCMGDKRRCA